jgi:histidyl-tRNA synthetase
LGLKKTRLIITDLHIFGQILEHCGLSDREKLFVMNHIRILQKGDEALLHVKEKARTFSLPQPDSPPNIDLVDVSSMSKTKARQLIAEMLKKDDMGFLGRRTADQITERLLRKGSGNYDSSKMNIAIEIVGALAMIAGDPQDCLRAAKEIIKKYELSSISLENLEQALNLLSSGNIGDTSVVVDFGLARGISYYTGIIFELTDATGTTSFGGGGRYDGLATSLGSKRKLPALGFAYNLEHLIEYIKETMQPTHIRGDTTRNTLVLPMNSAAYEKALEVAKDLRANQNNVEVDVCMRDLKESMAYALSNNIDVIVTVGESGVEKEYNVV